MAQLDICDVCGSNLAHLDRFHLAAGIIAVGLLEIDLCPTCAAPFWALPVGKTLLEQAKGARAAENARRAAILKQNPPIVAPS